MSKLQFDASFGAIGCVVGIDEVGLGAWCGPLVAVALVVRSQNIPDGIDDSKKLSAKQRSVVYQRLVSSDSVVYGIGYVYANEIDAYGLSKAHKLAVKRAVAELQSKYDGTISVAIVDGIKKFDDVFNMPAVYIVDGDSKSAAIGAASIIAKVSRDTYMSSLPIDYINMYHLREHKGYGTQKHIDALWKHGVSCIHRGSYKSVMEINIMQNTKLNPSVVIVSGISGAGKTTIVNNAVMSEYSSVIRCVACTTRQKRPQEINGVDYHFVTRSEFQQYIDNNQMIEWEPVLDNFYGIRRSDLENQLKLHKTVVIVMNVVGALKMQHLLQQQGVNVISVFVWADLSQIYERLIKRGEQQDEAKKRLLTAEAEMLDKDRFDYMIYNQDITQASTYFLELCVNKHINK